MIKDKGVYTTKCPKCTRSIVMHVLSDGSISPDMCPECELGFEGIDRGKERNTFVIVSKTGKSKVVVNEEAKKTSEVFQVTKKDDKKSFLPFQITKKNNKKSFGW